MHPPSLPEPPTDATGLTCTHHPNVAAGWECGFCNTKLCPDCAAPAVRGRDTKLAVCVFCDGPATVLQVPATPPVGFTQRFMSFVQTQQDVPALPNVLPRGSRATVEEPHFDPDESVEIKLDGNSTADPTAPILTALLNNDNSAAVTMFLADSDKLGALLPLQALFTLGTLLAKDRQVPMAIAALKRVAYANDPIAAHALFLLARLYTDVRNDYDTAETHLRTLLRKFPNSPEAAGAEQMLKRLGYGPDAR
jgi:hypothetical protein